MAKGCTILRNDIVTERGNVDISSATQEDYAYWERKYILPIIGEHTYKGLNIAAREMDNQDFEIGLFGTLYYDYWSKRMGVNIFKLMDTKELKEFDNKIPRN